MPVGGFSWCLAPERYILVAHVYSICSSHHDMTRPLQLPEQLPSIHAWKLRCNGGLQLQADAFICSRLEFSISAGHALAGSSLFG